MGGRGSGGGKGGGGSTSKAQEIPKTTAPQPTKEEILKQKRLDALAKARAKRAENLKKPKVERPKKEESSKLPSNQKISEMVSKIAPNSRGWEWESEGKDMTVFFNEPKKIKNSTWNKLEKHFAKYGVTNVSLARR